MSLLVPFLMAEENRSQSEVASITGRSDNGIKSDSVKYTVSEIVDGILVKINSKSSCAATLTSNTTVDREDKAVYLQACREGRKRNHGKRSYKHSKNIVEYTVSEIVDGILVKINSKSSSAATLTSNTTVDREDKAVYRQACREERKRNHGKRSYNHSKKSKISAAKVNSKLPRAATLTTNTTVDREDKAAYRQACREGRKRKRSKRSYKRSKKSRKSVAKVKSKLPTAASLTTNTTVDREDKAAYRQACREGRKRRRGKRSSEHQSNKQS